MAEPVHSLLARAAAVYDAAGNGLQARAGRAALGGFASAAEWMGLALGVLRHAHCPGLTGESAGYQWLGVIKYGLAGGTAAAWVVVAVGLGLPWLAPGALVAFYAVEAQMVFLFPLALDGAPRPFREARRWTVQAGGTLRVMRTVLPVAAVMLFGGFAGRGFVRSWCLGCLAVCLWYETVRTGREVVPAAGAAPAR